MSVRFTVFTILLHVVTSLGIGWSLVFLILDAGQISNGWTTHLSLLARNIGRYPHGFYIAAALACIMIVPIRAAIDDLRTTDPSKGMRYQRTILFALMTPVIYGTLAVMLNIFFRHDMTIYARTTVTIFMPIMLAMWALASIPATLIATHLCNRRYSHAVKTRNTTQNSS